MQVMQYNRSFLLLTDDVKSILEFIEPDDINPRTSGFRIHSLLLRLAIEFEANLHAILTYNKFPQKKYDMRDYHLVEVSHKLSRYRFRMVHWKGDHGRFVPIKEWSSSHTLSWYLDYNLAKHDRQENFQRASFESMINSYCALCALIWSQFHTIDFTMHTRWSSGTDNLGFKPMAGDVVTILPPDPFNFEERECYGFSQENWAILQASEPDPFMDFNDHSVRLSKQSEQTNPG